MCAIYWKLLPKETRNIQERMSKYGHFEIFMLPWKQLKFTKFICFRNLELWKHTIAKFHLYMFHKQEIK